VQNKCKRNRALKKANPNPDLHVQLEPTILKSLLLLNGGACISILAFVGNIWTVDKALSVAIVSSLDKFSYGLVFAVIAMIASSNANLLVGDRKNHKIQWLLSTAMIVLSLTCFSLGVRNATSSVKTQISAIQPHE
jgi:hypothetical protein